MSTFVLHELDSVTAKCYSKYQQKQIIQETEENLCIIPQLDLFDIVSDQYTGKELSIDTKYWNISIILL